MKRLVSLLIFYIFSACSYGSEGLQSHKGSDVKDVAFGFSITASKAPYEIAEFKLCNIRGEYSLLQRVRERGAEFGAPKKILLQESESLNLLRTYDSAINFNVRDNQTGFDGSSWCLTRPGTGSYLQACFWSPSYQAEKRGLQGVVGLGQELWRLSKLSAKYGEI